MNFLIFFDKIDSGFVEVYRIEGQTDIEISTNYLATGSLANRTLMLVDPMLTTGKPLVSTLKKLLKFGESSSIHLACTIAAPEGINYINENFDRSHTIWAGDVKKLDENSYIVSGLGDAGNLSFGNKL